ncbi:MAG: hypothetical protein A2735_02110 [Candidatus Yanofskybacteria bacterium RIFCSPHIGHO2_01_FULL_41_21]|uniref:Uncharacterized protein n=1 Tax=Candidatus Yanofskybacteria bacterium RIFCSPHIGHO2_01_FULL_41_21 TaxID=1802660 RepID=A0A1F8EBY5_9BACT|nr:MAG: hypothetical protein A2735_02110 [Candidatus Yanofskybacteria bacterium RIFCSPHIGHO2_01_FULL_41_21]
MTDEQDNSINSVQDPNESTPVVPSEPAPIPVLEEPAVVTETPVPVLPSGPVIPPTPTPAPAPITSPAPASLKSFLGKALEKIQFRKRAKLAKTVELAVKKRSITNDDVQKLLRVSDATATRYLSELVRQGKLRRAGTTSGTRYEPFDLTQGEPTPQKSLGKMV